MSLPDRQRPTVDVPIGLFAVDERVFSVKPTQFSQTVFSLAPEESPKNIPDSGVAKGTGPSQLNIRSLSGRQMVLPGQHRVTSLLRPTENPLRPTQPSEANAASSQANGVRSWAERGSPQADSGPPSTIHSDGSKGLPNRQITLSAILSTI